jgi:dipeptidyl aminopeptidase/acylaminoacyl peptidase
MKLRSLAVCLVIAAAAMPGCLPQKSAVWSPDGSRLAVIGAAGVIVADPAGKVLAEPFAPETELAAWLPDNRTLLVARKAQVSRWADVAAVLPEDTRKEYEALAERTFDDLKTYRGTWADLQDEINQKKDAAAVLEEHNLLAAATLVRKHNSNHLGAILLRMGEEHRDALKQFMGEGAKSLDETKVDIWSLETFDAGAEKPQPVKMLLRTLDPIFEIRISPGGKAIAFTVTPDSGLGKASADTTLYVVASDGNAPPYPVAEGVSAYPDWTPDGQNLVFARTNSTGPVGKDEVRLGTISRRRVCGPEGAPLAALDAVQDLAGTLFQPLMQVRCLPNGNILFGAIEAHLPTTAKDLQAKPALFEVSPTEPVAARRVFPPQSASEASEGVTYFEVSPGGTRAAAYMPDGKIFVITLASGESQTITGAAPFVKDKGPPGVIPVWRNAEELCFAFPAGSPQAGEKRGELVLWSAAGQRVISKDWPDMFVVGVLVPAAKEAKAAEPAPVPDTAR